METRDQKHSNIVITSLTLQSARAYSHIKENKTPAEHWDIFRQKRNASARVRPRVCQADALPTEPK